MLGYLLSNPQAFVLYKSTCELFSVTASVPCQTEGEKIFFFLIFWDGWLPLSLPVYNQMALTVDGELKRDKSGQTQLDLPMNIWTGGWEGEGQFSSFPTGLGLRVQGTLGTRRKQHSIRWLYVNNSQRVSQSSWPASCSNLRQGCSEISRYLTGARRSKCWALQKAINIPEQMCYPQERPLPGAPGHWARCMLVPMTSGSRLQIGCQQAKRAVTGAGNFIDGIGFTNYPQNTLKWNIKFPIP